MSGQLELTSLNVTTRLVIPDFKMFTFIIHLYDDPHVDGHHDHAVDQSQQLGESQLDLGVGVVAGEHEENQGHQVDEEGGHGVPPKHHLHSSGYHHVDTTGAYEGAHHNTHLQL